MKPAKASELLDLEVNQTPSASNPDLKAAIRIGKEAIDRLLTMRSYGIKQALLPLPGENPIPDLSPSADRKQRLRESPLGKEPRN